MIDKRVRYKNAPAAGSGLEPELRHCGRQLPRGGGSVLSLYVSLSPISLIICFTHHVLVVGLVLSYATTDVNFPEEEVAFSLSIYVCFSYLSHNLFHSSCTGSGASPELRPYGRQLPKRGGNIFSLFVCSSYITLSHNIARSPATGNGARSYYGRQLLRGGGNVYLFFICESVTPLSPAATR